MSSSAFSVCPGFNPVWNQTFSFVVQAPDYTYIRFKVMDKDWGPNVDDFIGQFSAPLESIMPGEWSVCLNLCCDVSDIVCICDMEG